MASIGLLGALGGFAKAAYDDRMDEQKRQRDLNDYKSKEEFAANLQERLLERKMQLAQQYPQYQHFVTDPRTGAVTGFTQYGQVAELKPGSKEQTQLYDMYKQALIEKNQAAGAQNEARIGLLGQQAATQSALEKLYNAKASTGGFAPKAAPKPALAKAPNVAMIKLRAQQLDPEAFAKPDFMGSEKANELARRQAAATAKATAELQSASSIGSAPASGMFNDLIPSDTTQEEPYDPYND